MEQEFTGTTDNRIVENAEVNPVFDENNNNNTIDNREHQLHRNKNRYFNLRFCMNKIQY